jgi:hypothetical protein
MADVNPCLDCRRTRLAETFYKTRGGAGRSTRCRDCIETRAKAHRAEKQTARQEADAELIEFLSDPSNGSKLLPPHLLEAFNRLEPRPAPKPRKLSNRPQMARCQGCGEAVPKRDLWEYRRGVRARYCKPCMRRRAVERECEACSETKLTPEFFEGLRGVSPYCRACRDQREREKHCPRCSITKPVGEFNRSAGRLAGWCKQCSVEAQRARRAAARSQTG